MTGRRLLAAALLCAFAACKEPGQPGTGRPVEPTYYGNGVYYFPAVSTSFADTLAAFAGTHRIIAITSVSQGGDIFVGGTIGYFVVTDEKGPDLDSR